MSGITRRSFQAACLLPIPAMAIAPARSVRVAVFTASRVEVAELRQLRDSLAQLGYVDGRNLQLEIRATGGVAERVEPLAREIVAMQPDVIVAFNAPLVRAIASRTSTTPIVMAWVFDPVGTGLIKSLREPGGNITGVANMQDRLLAKRIEIGQQLAPASRIAVFAGRDNPVHVEQARLAALYAHRAGLAVSNFTIAQPADLRPAFAAARRAGARVVLVLGGPPFTGLRSELAENALDAGLGISGSHRASVEAGGLFSYAPSVAAQSLEIAAYVDRIVNGQKPATLPVQEPREFELVINARTAKRLGFTITPALQIMAEVIE